MAPNKIPVSLPHDSRANQKERTRKAIVDAAMELVAEGDIPSVADAAERAKVSRATAYRYFPTQDDLGEALAARHRGIAAVDQVVANMATGDVEKRLVQLLDAYNPSVIFDEAFMRATLRSFMDNWLKAPRDVDASRPYGRTQTRLRWLDAALQPVHGLSERRRKRLQAALSLTLGIEAIVVMKDVCQLDDDDALAVLRWTATSLLRAGLEEGRPSASSTAAETSSPTARRRQ